MSEIELEKKFTPMVFLAPLGAGGISVAFFAYLNYIFEHGEGLITYSQIHEKFSGLNEIFFYAMDIGMFLFVFIHFWLMLKFSPPLFKWLKSKSYKEFLENPLVHSGVLVPFVAIIMTMNVFLGSIRYFIPWMDNNLQALMIPGLIGWGLIWISLMRMEIKLLKISFEVGFDISKINFGWLLHSFTLAMLTVTGSGIAAMSKAAIPAHIAFSMLLVSGTMALFLLIVKSITIFRSYFEASGLPDKQFLPSILIVVPNITLLAITLFRLGHYFHNHLEAHVGKTYYTLVTMGAFAFETWYLAFGIALLSKYFRQNLKNEFHVSQWGLICPFVAYGVIGMFVYDAFLQSKIFAVFLFFVTMITVALFLFLLIKQCKCSSGKNTRLQCD